MKKTLAQREKVLLYGALTLFILSAAFGAFVRPAAKKNAELNRQIQSGRIKIKKYGRLLSQKDILQEKYAGFLRSSKGLTSLEEIEQMAQDANVRIVDIRPQALKRAGAPGGGVAAIDIRLEATLPDYLKFIYDIEHSLFLFSIKRFQLNARADSGLLEGVFSIYQLSDFF